MLELALVATVLLSACVVLLLRSHRVRLYREMTDRQQAMRQNFSAGGAASLVARRLPTFDEYLAVLPNALPDDQFQALAGEIEKLNRTERSYLPTHKKGGTVAYETLCSQAPGVVAFYMSHEVRELISGIVGVDVVPTPVHDQSSCSVLFYEQPGDHIGWHFDHNFYRGRHFTVLLAIVNRNATHDGLSAARLFGKIGKEEREIPTPPNELVVFEGARIVHKATPIDKGERRVVLSMTFCTDPRNSLLQGAARRIKDTAFFGIRALWT